MFCDYYIVLSIQCSLLMFTHVLALLYCQNACLYSILTLLIQFTLKSVFNVTM